MCPRGAKLPNTSNLYTTDIESDILIERDKRTTHNERQSLKLKNVTLK